MEWERVIFTCVNRAAQGRGLRGEVRWVRSGSGHGLDGWRGVWLWFTFSGLVKLINEVNVGGWLVSDDVSTQNSGNVYVISLLFLTGGCNVTRGPPIKVNWNQFVSGWNLEVGPRSPVWCVYELNLVPYIFGWGAIWLRRGNFVENGIDFWHWNLLPFLVKCSAGMV